LSVECCVLSGIGLCDELITRPEESYLLWCVIVCDLEKNLKNEEAMTRVGSQGHQKKKRLRPIVVLSVACRPVHLACNMVEWRNVVSTTINCWIPSKFGILWPAECHLLSEHSDARN